MTMGGDDGPVFLTRTGEPFDRRAHEPRSMDRANAKGMLIPPSDLLIGATALELGYSIGTANFRHFQLIPELNVIQL